ncbi:MAG TPA: hypothetical protein VFR84_14790 [Candidatus Angelobacter sp.]|nr:hypothetical protein [Candidatus Angelobacter sp.]
MNIRRAAVFSALLLCTSLALAQAATPNNTFSSTLSGGINLRSIAGAPFSADVIRESTRVLPDGSSVPVLTRGKMFRDAEGRTRSEMEMVSSASASPRKFVTIVDPVARVSMVLDPQMKTATVVPLPSPAPADAVGARAATAERISAKSLAIVGAKDLGASMLQGFSVTGSRRSRTVQAKTTTVETWFSPDLKVELQAKTDNPDGSAMTTRLENIVTAEPDLAMFEPPADYVVKTISPSK